MSNLAKVHKAELKQELQRMQDRIVAHKITPLRSEVVDMVGMSIILLAVIMLVGAPPSVMLTIAMVLGAVLIGRHREACVDMYVAKREAKRLSKELAEQRFAVEQLQEGRLRDSKAIKDLAEQVGYYRREIEKEEKSRRYG